MDTPEENMVRVHGVKRGFSQYAGYDPVTGRKIDVYAEQKRVDRIDGYSNRSSNPWAT